MNRPRLTTMDGDGTVGAVTASGFCPNCARTVYIGAGDEVVCPVCSGALIFVDRTNELRARQIGENEARARSINERIKKSSDGGSEEFVCECGRDDCGEIIFLRIEDYELIRRGSRRFVVYPGHQMPDVEVVVEAHDTHLVVSKTGEAGETAELTDPRS
jgi:uncharacterized Zn finger protein (UPF0148 family)